MPHVSILYFAGVADRLGITGERLAIPAETTVSAIFAHVSGLHPEIATHLLTCRLAVDQQFVSGAVVLIPDSELAVIPPVSGG